MKHRNVLGLAAIGLALVGFSWPLRAQQEAAPLSAVHVIGLAGVKDNAKGTMKVENGHLQFAYGKNRIEISAASITDIATGDDTKATIGKSLSLMSMAAPYGTGRALGMFRTKIDTLTIQYRGADGELHGVIFAVADGSANDLKQALLEQGAHSSAGEGPSSTASPENSANKEKEQ